MRKLRRSAVLVLGMLLLAALVGGSPAQAGETDTFRFEPHPLQVDGENRRQFTYDLRPGNSRSDHVRIVNKTDSPRTFRVYAADAFEDPDTGVMSVAPESAPDRGIASWIAVGRSEVEVAPRASRTIEFTVARPGDGTVEGTGAIVAEEIRDTATGGGIEVVYRIAILVRLGGEAPSIGLTTPQLELPLRLVPSHGTVTAEISNATSQPVQAQIVFNIESLTGREWQPPPVPVTLEPGSSEIVNAQWNTVPRWGGAFRVRAVATWEVGTVSTSSPRSLHPPLWLLAISIVLVGIRALREMWARRGDRRRAMPTPNPDALRGRLIEVALWLHAAGRDAPAELREAAATEARAIAAEAERTPDSRDIQRAARSLEACARDLGSGGESARRSANDFDTWLRQQRDDPRIKELVGS